jgi:tryptophan synthase alpha chain
MPQPASVSPRSIAESFARLRGKGIGLLPFLPAGYPDLKTTQAIITELDSVGVAAIEIGFPFSDPIADGPVIQQAFTIALQKKIKVAEIFAAISEISPKILTPLVAMVSYSIVFRYGIARFAKDAKAAGFSGLIVPDLPPPEAQSVCSQIRAAGLETILLVAPTTEAHRRAEIVGLCSGFVYYLSLSGITGERADLPADVLTNVRQLKSLTATPVCVGFYISKPQHVQSLAGVADGAIVGSAIVRLITQTAPNTPIAIAQAVAKYCRQLINAPNS